MLSWSVNRWDPILQGMEHFSDRRLGKTPKRGEVRRAWRSQTVGGERILREALGVWCSGRGRDAQVLSVPVRLRVFEFLGTVAS